MNSGNSEPARLLPFILHESKAGFAWKGSGALSLKTFRGGTTLYEAGRGYFSVDDHRFLVLNAGQEYALHIDSPTEVESFCVFFPDGFVERIGQGLVQSEGQRLDDPFGSRSTKSFEWVERTHSMQSSLGETLRQLRHLHRLKTLDAWGWEERMHDLAVRLLRLHKDVRKEMDNLSAAKLSTREELYRRAYLGHEYLTAYYDQSPSLADTAAVAQLSVNHFLRSYKAVFGISPHRYLTECRLQAAMRLLQTTDRSVTDICFAVGFESLGTFSSLFARRFGEPPSQARLNR